MKKLIGVLVSLTAVLGLAGCSSTSGPDAGSDAGDLACVTAPICRGGANDGGCQAEDTCVAAPNLTCSQAVQCPPKAPGFICRDIPRCFHACLADVCPPATAFPDGGSASVVDGGRCLTGASDCVGNALGPHCVQGLCQSCGSDSDCSGGTSCVDLNVQRACNVASDCPGTDGEFVCQ